MSFIQIFVEDERNDAYEILAARSLNVDHQLRNQRRRHVRAARLSIAEFTSWESLLDSVARTQKAGSECILFILDEEDLLTSPDRAGNLDAFQNAFSELCAHIADLPNHNSLKRVKVSCIVCKKCLESWLLAYPQAIVTAMNGPSSYVPSVSGAIDFSPRQARNEIARIVQEVGNRTDKKHKFKSVSGHSVKSMGAKIASHVDPQQARQRNFSLDYFYDMITCQHSGCERPFSTNVRI